jgi:sodium/potassium-transporting ATPase subunit beta
MVKFGKLPTNRVVMIECRAYAANIELDPDTRSGMVTFEILKQDSRKRGT